MKACNSNEVIWNAHFAQSCDIIQSDPSKWMGYEALMIN